MHVNNYFIQTLVLVLGNSSDNVNISFENVTFTSGNSSHSLNAPEESIVRKNIGWSTLTENGCISPNPPLLDLDSIKKVVEYELLKNSSKLCQPKKREIKECVPKFIRKDSYGRLIPPHLWTKESFKDGIWPPPDFCLIYKYNVDQVIISTNTSISLIKDFDSKELYEWMLHSPTADVVIILVHEKWPEKLTEKINEAFSKSYVLVWDWSMYTYSSFLFTAAYTKLVGERLSQWILNLRIPGDKITIIGYSLSAHAAAFAGKHFYETSDTKIHKIIAINPSAKTFESPDTTPDQRLTADDADQVYVIHYGTKFYHTSLGTIDVYINNTQKILGPDSSNSEYSSTLDLFLIILNHLPLYPENVNHKVLVGFPFNVIFTFPGDYYLDLDKIVPTTEESQDTHLKEISSGLIVTVCNDGKPTTVDPQGMEHWFVEHHSEQIVIILTDEKFNTKWLKSLVSLLDHPDTKILFIDWSYFKMNDDLTSPNKILVNWTAHSAPNIILIGVGLSAYLATTVALKVNEATDAEFHKLVLLNPPHDVLDILDSFLARLILVVDSNFVDFTTYPDTVDIQIDHGMFYCVLEDDQRYEARKCLNQIALKFFIDMLRFKQIKVRSFGNVTTVAPYEDGALQNGLYECFISDFFVEFDVTRAPLGFDNSKLTYTFITHNKGISVNVLDWLQDNPNGEILIIITCQEGEDARFLAFMENVSRKTTSVYYIMTVNWSAYYFPSSYTNDYIRLVADAIANRIRDLKFPIEIITLFGSEESAQVASLIGKTVKQSFGKTIRRIVAYNPEGEANYIPKKYYLSSTDATQVLAIHIDSGSSTIAPVPSGTIDVFIYFVETSHCRSYQRKECLNHIMHLLIRSINDIRLPIFDSKGNELVGFPLDIDLKQRGIYKLLLKVSAAGLYFGVAPGETKVQSMQTADVHEIYVVFNGTTYGITNDIDYAKVEVPCENETVIILNDKHYSSDWSLNLKKAILESGFSKAIHEIDLSIYKKFVELPDRVYLKTMADAIASWIIRMKLCPEKLTIIGLGNGAHLAGLIGKVLKTDRIISRIIALNPTSVVWVNLPETERLSPSDAQQVVVVHTETTVYGFVSRLGTVDIYVLYPKDEKPQCKENDELICFHLYAAQVVAKGLLNSSSIVIESDDGRLLDGFPFSIDTYETGLFRLFNANKTSTVIVSNENTSEIVNLALVSIDGSRVTIKDVNDWQEKYPDAIIVIGVETEDHAWRVKLKYIPGNNNLFIFYDIQQESHDVVVDHLSRWIHLANIAQEKLILVGYGITTNIVGRIGHVLQVQFHFLPSSIIALNPSIKIQSSQESFTLTSTDAQQVVSISTDTDHDTRTLNASHIGTVNIVSEKGCKEQTDSDCSTNQAVTILTEYIRNAFTIDQYFTLPVVQALNQNENIVVVEVPEYHKQVVVQHDSDPNKVVISSVDNGYEFNFNIDVAIISQWLKLHPLGEIVIILKGDKICNQPKWDEELVHILNDHYLDIYSIVIDWSPYNDNSAYFTGYPQLLVYNLASYIYKHKIPIDRLVFIGVGKSAHIAGLVSKQLYYLSRKTMPYKIIAISPYLRPEWIKLSETERLSKTDAHQVMIIDTDDSIYNATPEALGTINVFIGGSHVPYIHPEEDPCLESYALHVFILALHHPEIMVFNKQLLNFPLSISLDTAGAYIATKILEGSENAVSTELPPTKVTTESSYDISSPTYYPTTEVGYSKPLERGHMLAAQLPKEDNDRPKTEPYMYYETTTPAYSFVTTNDSNTEYPPTTTENPYNDYETTTYSFVATNDSNTEYPPTTSENAYNDYETTPTKITTESSYDISSPTYYPTTEVGYSEPIERGHMSAAQKEDNDRPTTTEPDMYYETITPAYSFVTTNDSNTEYPPPTTEKSHNDHETTTATYSFITTNDSNTEYPPTTENPYNDYETTTYSFVATNDSNTEYPLTTTENPYNDYETTPTKITTESAYDISSTTYYPSTEVGYPEPIERGHMSAAQKEDNDRPTTTEPDMYYETTTPAYLFVTTNDSTTEYPPPTTEKSHNNHESTTPTYSFITTNDSDTEYLPTTTENTYNDYETTPTKITTESSYDRSSPPNPITEVGHSEPIERGHMSAAQFPKEDNDRPTTTEPDMYYETTTPAYSFVTTNDSTTEYPPPTTEKSHNDHETTTPTYSFITKNDSDTEYPTTTENPYNDYETTTYSFVATNDSNTEYPSTTTEEPDDTSTDRSLRTVIIENRSDYTIKANEENNSTFLRLVEKHGRIFIILTAKEEEDNDWTKKFVYLISKVSFPSYVMVIQWSLAESNTFEDNIVITQRVASQVVEWIHRENVPTSITTIIGFGTSAHVAGLIGKMVHIKFNLTINAIIALNPAGVRWITVPDDQKLSKTDANNVIVIHTETQDYGYPTNIGTTDIVINPNNTQPWCNGPMRAHCAYFSVIPIFLEGIKHMLFNTKSVYVLPGFPFNMDTNLHEEVPITLSTVEDLTSIRVVELPAATINLIQQFIKQENVYIVITDREEGNRKWTDAFNNLLSNSDSPSYVLVVDWSAYVQERFKANLYVTNLVADDIIQWIDNTHVSPSIITVIGFGTSAHVAGLVGKKIQLQFGWILRTIVALNPAGKDWIHVPISEKLSRTDANKVIVVHTESRHYGYTAPLGTVDIFINPNNEQPWCTGSSKAYCAYLSVIDIFLAGVKNLLYGSNSLFILPGFPFEVLHNIHGVFRITMQTKEDTRPLPQLPDSEVNILESETIGVAQWLGAHKGGKVVVIITARSSPDLKWPERLLEILIKNNTFVIIIDWSAFKSHIWYKSRYTDLVVRTIVKYIARKQIPPDTLTLIGFGESAHVAGLVGQEISGMFRIIALNPTGREWTSLEENERLSPTDATQVLAIHTETKTYGYLKNIGTVDVFVNKPDVGQPWCYEPNKDLCSHFSAIDIFLKGINHELEYPDGIIPDLKEFPFGVDIRLTGDYNIKVLLEKTKIKCEIGPSGVKITQYNGMSYTEWISIKGHSTKVVMLLTGHESRTLDWIDRVASALAPEYYVLVVDWSRCKQTDHGLLVLYINALSKLLSDYIKEQELPLDKLTLIGFGVSAHLAGLIGQQQTSSLYKIIALDAMGGKWINMVPSQRLNSKDATEVVAIHTETETIGYPDNLGTVDVYVQKLDDVCLTSERAVCLHEFSIQIFLYFLKLHLPSIFGIYLNHFPLISTSQHNGDYFLDYHYLISPKYWPVEIIEVGEEWPAVDFAIAEPYDANNVSIKFYKPTREVIAFNVSSPRSIRSVVQGVAHFFIIVTEEPAEKWAHDLTDKLLKASTSNYVIIVDWSMYVFNSYMFTAAYSKRVADTVADWVHNSEIPSANLEMIGYATSGHVIGLMGNYLREKNYIVERMVALDPAHRMWSHNEASLKVNMQSANLVQVIHTNIGYYGYSDPLGHFDIYVNDGIHQPHCKSAENVNKCSHMAAVLYYMDSIKIRAQARETGYYNGTLTSEGKAYVDFGYWLTSYTKYKPGVYRLDTNEDYHYLNGYVDLSEHDLVMEPTEFNSTRYIHRDFRQIIFSGFSNYVKTEFSVESPLYRIPLPATWFNVYDGGQVFVILDKEEKIGLEWMDVLKDTILTNVPKSMVLSFTWMRYKYGYKVDSELARPIGETIADILTTMFSTYVPYDKVHIIGHSIGAHVGGFIGKRLKQKYSIEVARLTALDPAGPLWSDELNQDRLTHKDAKIVDVIHTDVNLYGYPRSIGDVDFYVNFGGMQPNCEDQNDSCSHHRSVHLFLESFERKSLALHVEVRKDVLIYSQTTAFATFGYYLEPEARGSYIILTNKTPPFLKIQEETKNVVVTSKSVKMQTNLSDNNFI